MKKRILALLLVLCLTAGMMPVVSAETIASGTCGENVTWVLTDDGTLTISGEGAMADYAGVRRDWPPYNDYYNLIDTVNIEYGITYIGKCAFDGVCNLSSCSYLTSVTIPNSVTTIGRAAFYYCKKLTTVTIPDSVTFIDGFAFGDCDGLTSVMIPDSVTFIGEGVFSSCDSLTGIWVDSNNPSYSNDESGVLFNKSQTELTQVPCTISGSYVVPDSVTSIYPCAFEGCVNLTNIVFPDSLTSIGDAAFFDCTSLTTIDLPDRLTSINQNTFNKCTNLTSVMIPSSISSIGYCAFYRCDNLTDIYYSGTEEQWGKIYIDKNNECLNNATIHFESQMPAVPQHPQNGDFALIYEPQENLALSSLKTGKYNQCNMLGEDPQNTSNYLRSEIWEVLIAQDGSYQFRQNGKLLGTSADQPYLDLDAAHNHWNLADLGNGLYTIQNSTTGKYLAWSTKEEHWYCAADNDVGSDSLIKLSFHTLDPKDPCIKGFSRFLDGWCNPNAANSFGYPSGYSIDRSKYYDSFAFVDLDISGNFQGLITPKWQGNCFGLSLLAVANYLGKIDLSSYFDRPGEYLGEYGYNDIAVEQYYKEGVLKFDGEIFRLTGQQDIIDLVERAQVSQFSSDIESEECFEWDSDYSDLLKHLNGDNPTPIIITFVTGMNGHTVVTDTTSKPEEVADGVYKVNCYDCNNPFDVLAPLEDGWDCYSYQPSYVLFNTKTGEYTYRYHDNAKTGFYNIAFLQQIRFYDISDLPESFFTDKLKYSSTDSTNMYQATDITVRDRFNNIALFKMDQSGNAFCAEGVEHRFYSESFCSSSDYTQGTILLPEGDYTFATKDDAVLSRVTSDAVFAYGVDGDARVTFSDTDNTITLTNTSEERTAFACVTQDPDGSVSVISEGTLDGGDSISITVDLESDYPSAKAVTDGDPSGIDTAIMVDGDIVQENFHIIGTVNPFSDVPEGSFYYEPVMWAVKNGITNGATETTYNPNGTCLRAQVVTFLYRAAGSPAPNSTKNPFTDVKSGDFYYNPVLWAVEKGITQGISKTQFGSTQVCNRAAVVTFLWRAFGSPEPKSTNNPFVDVKNTDFFYKPVLWAVENGITAGIDATHFNPAGACNRAQVVTFLYRAYN